MDVDAVVAQIATGQYGVITFRQATELLVTRSAIRHRLRVGRWIEVHPRVYAIAGVPQTWHQRVTSAVLAAGPHGHASHLSAAALHGLPGFHVGPVHITVPRDHHHALADVTVHESLLIPEHHVWAVNGISLTTVARTLFDLAGSVHPARAERALDNALTRRLVTLPSCWRVLIELAQHGREGTVLMRTMLAARSGDYVAPASELERRLLAILRDHGLPTPEREIDLGDRDGWVGRVEVVYQDVRLLIEADSRRHHGSFLDQAADRARDNRFMADGYRVLRFTWDDVTTRPGWVADTVRHARRAAA